MSGDYSIYKAKSKQDVKDCIKNGEDVNLKNSEGDTPLHKAKNEEVVMALIEKGADVNAENKSGRTPIYCHLDNDIITSLLIKEKADFKSKNKYGFTPLHGAQTPEIVETLVSNGADIDAKNVRDITPVMSAVISKNHGVVNALAQKGANLKIADKKTGNTPLHEAVENGSPECVEALLKNNAEIQIFNRIRKTPRQMAFEMAKDNHPNAKKILALFEKEKRGEIQKNPKRLKINNNKRNIDIREIMRKRTSQNSA